MSENSVLLINWLEDYGTYHGDRMPDSTDVLLPYKSVKIDLFRKYRQVQARKGIMTPSSRFVQISLTDEVKRHLWIIMFLELMETCVMMILLLFIILNDQRHYCLIALGLSHEGTVSNVNCKAHWANVLLAHQLARTHGSS